MARINNMTWRERLVGTVYWIVFPASLATGVYIATAVSVIGGVAIISAAFGAVAIANSLIRQ